MNPHISIVIPTISQAIDLKPTLASCLASANHCGLTVEIMLVNNSTYKITNDDFSELGTPSKIILLSSARGANAARNAGLSHARAKIVLFLDDDCVIKDLSFLKAHLESHEKYPDAVAIGGNYSLSKNSEPLGAEYVRNQREWLLRGQHSNSNQINYLLGGNMSLKKSMCKLHDLQFDENIKFGGAETELFVRILKLNLKCYLIQSEIEHCCNLTLYKLCKKIYMQARGKKYREQKHGVDIANKIYMHKPILSKDQTTISRLTQYIFKIGYSI